MEQINEREVWQRVRGSTDPDPEQLIPLIALTAGNAQAYRRLSRLYRGQPAARLMQLHRESLHQAACLKGIYRLQTGQLPQAAPISPSAKDNPEGILRQCYGRQMQALAAYEARSADPVWGQAFRHLVQQCRPLCQTLLTVIGSLQ